MLTLQIEYDRLRGYPSVQKWLNELGNGSQESIKNALYAIYRYEKSIKKNPDQLIDERSKEVLSKNIKVRFRAEDSLKAFVNNTKGGATLGSFIKSFYRANHLPLEVSIQRGPPKREIEKIPDNEQLFKLCTIAQGPLRPLLYLMIESGARIGSVLQLKFGHIKEDYEADKIPCSVRFPSKITKGNIPYVAFVGRDTVNSLREFIKIRQRQGEQITNDSYLFVSKNRKALSKTTTIVRIGRLAFRAGIISNSKGLKEFHPHVLRKRAQTILEGSSIPLNWVDYLLGHVPRGSSAGAYSRPTEEQLRDSYRVALPKLAIRPIDRAENVGNLELKKAMLMIAYSGKPPEIDITGLDDQEYMEIIQKGLEQRFQNKLTINGSRQKVIPINEVKDYIVQGWEYVAALPDSSAIVKLPQ